MLRPKKTKKAKAFPRHGPMKGSLGISEWSHVPLVCEHAKVRYKIHLSLPRAFFGLCIFLPLMDTREMIPSLESAWWWNCWGRRQETCWRKGTNWAVPKTSKARHQSSVRNVCDSIISLKKWATPQKGIKLQVSSLCVSGHTATRWDLCAVCGELKIQSL